MDIEIDGFVGLQFDFVLHQGESFRSQLRLLLFVRLHHVLEILRDSGVQYLARRRKRRSRRRRKKSGRKSSIRSRRIGNEEEKED